MADRNGVLAPYDVSDPPYRRLRIYAFDPTLATQMETALINRVTIQIPWEGTKRPPHSSGSTGGALSKGPVGEYIEVVDYDPASGCFYAPVDLNDPHLLAQDGLAPSEGIPQFHQQMVYAVAMRTISNFEHALGRRALWSPRNGRRDGSNGEFVRRLRIYPHAMRHANAYYSPKRKALLFGYFPAGTTDPGGHMAGGQVFTCLSHDIIAHETTHALLDGLHHRLMEPTNPDVLAFHEAFADIVALLQHFSYPEALRHQIAKTRGNLFEQSLLGELAQQFGRATGRRGALRSAIGSVDARTGQWTATVPDPELYQGITQPHRRGSLLVAAIFGAFLTIYKSRVEDLLRLGSSIAHGNGELHPDLVNRLATTASKTAQHILNICIRALDYCPPVDLTFGDYLRAMITADYDLVPDDPLQYRVALIESFRDWGLYPRDVRTLSEESLRWQQPTLKDRLALSPLMNACRRAWKDVPLWNLETDREEVFRQLRACQEGLCRHLSRRLAHNRTACSALGLDPAMPGASLEVEAIRPSRRIGPSGQAVLELAVVITQSREVQLREKPSGNKTDGGKPPARYKFRGERAVLLDPFTGVIKRCRRRPTAGNRHDSFIFRGGATLLLDPSTGEVRYAVAKSICDDRRLKRQAEYRQRSGGALYNTYFGGPPHELFAMLHGHGPEEGDHV